MTVFGSDSVDLATLPCARAEALRRIYLILNEEIFQGLAPDMSRSMTITDPTGAMLLKIPFTDALIGQGLLHCSRIGLGGSLPHKRWALDHCWAQARLFTNTVSISQVAFDASYGDAASCRQAFAKEVGLRPSAYRKRFGHTPARTG